MTLLPLDSRPRAAVNESTTPFVKADASRSSADGEEASNRRTRILVLADAAAFVASWADFA
jgi:hypothetical protein